MEMRKTSVLFTIIITLVIPLHLNALEADCTTCCDVPKEFANGKLQIVQRESQGLSIVPAGSTLQFECDKNYILTRKRSVICKNGAWSPKLPVCVAEVFCEVPDSIPNGRIIRKGYGDFYLPEEEIIIICDKGYTTGNKSDHLYCDINGKWDEDIPQCIQSTVTCIIPEPPENGYILESVRNKNITSLPYRYEINFACNPGYILIGQSWRMCVEYGWNYQNPKCKEIKCPNPGRPENGWIQGTDFRVGNVTYFGCYSGYYLHGSARRVCMENGQWSGELSRCDSGDNHCPNPGSPIGGTKFGNRYEYGSEVTFECDPGRMLIGSSKRTCQLNGKWSGEETKCLGKNDFDGKRTVGYKIKSLLNEENMKQEAELNNYKLQLNQSTDVRLRRHINLNSPERLIFIFVFDVSGSIGELNFKRSINFAKAMVKVIRVSEEGARVGAITFSSTATKEFYPFDFNNAKDIIEALDMIEYRKGGTALSPALSLLNDDMIPLTFEVLGKSKYIVFITTDGKVNMAGNPIHEAKALKERNHVDIYCIGVTGNIMKHTLYDVASTKNKQVFILNGYDSLEWIVQDIVNETVDYSKCGVRRPTVMTIERKEEFSPIIKGMIVQKAWPWMAIIFIVDPYKPDTSRPLGVCGATLIDRKWILTAAHCLHDDKLNWRDKHEFIVNLGLIDIRNKTNIQERSVLRYVVHPSYESNTFDYNIALMELSIPAEYNEFVRPVCLPPPENELHKESTFYRAGELGSVVGWGYDRALEEKNLFKATHVNELRATILPLQKRETCQDSLKDLPENLIFTDRMICAGENGLGVCKGDGGGPLMQMLTNDIGEEYWTEVGIVSWGIGCGQPGRYGFYTKVSVFVEWIKEIIKN